MFTIGAKVKRHGRELNFLPGKHSITISYSEGGGFLRKKKEIVLNTAFQAGNAYIFSEAVLWSKKGRFSRDLRIYFWIEDVSNDYEVVAGFRPQQIENSSLVSALPRHPGEELEEEYLDDKEKGYYLKS